MVGPGWYPDPSGLWELRWWDGTVWSDHVVTGPCQSIEPVTPALSTPADPNQVGASAEGISEHEPVRLDLTWHTLNFVPLRRSHETRFWPLSFVVQVVALSPDAESVGTLRLTIRGHGYVGPSTVVLSKVARAHWVRALVLRQRAIMTGWPPN